jgi:hypothetical protein
MRLRLVTSATGNLFMRELLEALAAELPPGSAEVAEAFGPAEDDRCWAWIPHEFLGTRPAHEHPTPAHLARTVALHTEQPGTVWSERSIQVAGACGAVMDISRVGMVELRRNGLRPELLQLGWTAAWDRWGGADRAAREVDVAYLASANRRRDVHLAGALPWLEPWSCRLHVAPVAPKVEAGPAFRAGEDKLALLAGSRLLLNIRSQIPPYFEWVRALEAICNGAVYVTEHGAGQAPLVAGEHLVAAAPEHLGAVCDALLRDPDRIRAIRDAAYAHVRAELPLRAGALRLLEVAQDLAGRRAAAPAPAAAPPAAPRPTPPPLRFCRGPGCRTSPIPRWSRRRASTCRRTASGRTCARGPSSCGPRAGASAPWSSPGRAPTPPRSSRSTTTPGTGGSRG